MVLLSCIIVKKVFLDNLPRHINGKNKGKIDWGNSVGFEVPFIYNNIKGIIKIIDLDEKRNLTVEYCNEKFQIRTIDFYNARLARILKLRTSFHYEVGDIINTDYAKVIILQRDIFHGKRYKYKCLKCGNIDYIYEGWLEKGKYICNCCSGRKCVKGVNDLWTTNPEIAKLLKNPEDGYMHSSYSNKYVEFKCPYCGEIRTYRISGVTRKGYLPCRRCGDGISIPNKIMFNILKQLNVEFDTEQRFDFCKNLKINNHIINYGIYDFVLESLDLIIEMDGWYGHGHGKENKQCLTQEEQIMLDNLKDEVAFKNNFSVIRIDCPDDINIIISNIKESKLNYYFDLSLIDFQYVIDQSFRNLAYDICNEYKNGKSIYELCNLYKKSKGTIRKYLKIGTDIGWCNYSALEAQNSSKFKCKIILQFDKNGNFIKKYNSIKEASECTGINRSTISNCLRNKQEFAGGYIWKYADEIQVIAA